VTSTRVVCPVDGCDWTFDIPVQQVEGVLDSIFGPGVYAAVAHAQMARRTERAIELHMDGHKPEQFLRTITRLNSLVDDLSRALEYMEVES
jgi:hypothetical protein